MSKDRVACEEVKRIYLAFYRTSQAYKEGKELWACLITCQRLAIILNVTLVTPATNFDSITTANLPLSDQTFLHQVDFVETASDMVATLKYLALVFSSFHLLDPSMQTSVRLTIFGWQVQEDEPLDGLLDCTTVLLVVTFIIDLVVGLVVD